MNIIVGHVGVLSSSTLPWLMQALCEHYVSSNQNLSSFVQHVLDAPNLFVDAQHDKELMAFVIDGSLPTEEVPPKEVLARLVERAKHIPAGISWHHQLKHPRPPVPHPLHENFGYDIVEAGKQAAVAHAPKIQLHAFMVIAACFYVLSRRGHSEPTIWALLDAYMHIWDEMDQAQLLDSWLSPTFVGPNQ